MLKLETLNSTAIQHHVSKKPYACTRPLTRGLRRPPLTSGHRVILLVSSVHRGTLEALRYAQSISYDITAVHVAMDREESAKLRTDWALWGKGI